MTAVPALYLLKVDLPRIVSLAPVTVRVPFVTSSTIELDPSPTVVSAVIVTLLLTMAMSPHPVGSARPRSQSLTSCLTDSR